jgi:N-formylglutamate amidohydrolase
VIAPPPFVTLGPEQPLHPVLIAVPHAGRDYPAAMIPIVRLPFDRLRSLEDRHADRLADGVIAAGFRAIVAQTPRAWIDLNRAETEFDPGFVTAPQGMRANTTRKVAAGLGIIPRRVSHGGDIWRGPIARDDFDARLAGVHRPYHAAIAAELAALRDRFGCAILIDLHSMPPLPGHGGSSARIVIGDLFGRSAERWVADAVAASADRAGFRWAVNAPYAGGHSIDRHSAPAAGINAVQIEVCRSLYLDATRTECGPGLAKTTRFITDLAESLSGEALGRAMPLAAE